MNRTITSNIAGYIFHIDEDAYATLDGYLKTIRHSFSHSEGRDEIIADIEARLAEMLQERMGQAKQVVTLADVNEVIGIMGQPEAFLDEDAQGTDWSEPKGQKGNAAPKRLFRDPDNKVIGGVCSGISNYLGIADPIWLRLILVATFFVFGSGFLLYLVLLVIIPKARTRAEKLQMRGENVTVSNIEKRVNEELEAVKNKWNDLHGNSGTGRKLGDIVHRVVTLVGNIVILMITFFSKVIGIAFIVAGIIGLLVLASMALGLPSFISIGNSGAMSPVDVQYVLHNLVGGSNMLAWITIAAFLVWGIPLLALAFLGLKLIFNMKTRAKGIGLLFLGLWIIGIFAAFTLAMMVGSDFSSTGGKTESVELPLDADPARTIHLALNHELGADEPTNATEIFGLQLLTPDNSIKMYGKPEFTITMAKVGGPKLLIKRMARAKNKQDATDRASKIEYGFITTDTSLLLNGYFEIPENERWRTQEVALELQLPVGYTVYLSDELTQIIYDIKNTTNTYDGYMVGRKWTMTPQGLACVDCEGLNTAATSVGADADVQDADVPIKTKNPHRDLEKEKERLKREMKERKHELKKIERELEEKEESSEKEEASAFPKEIILKRVINATYWITPDIQRTVSVAYPLIPSL